MTDQPAHETRWRLARDVVVFQIKLGMEAVLDLTLIPVSLAAAAMDFLLGNWRRPRWFHAVLRFGERCEHRIDLWRVATPGMDVPQSEVDAAATKLAPSGDGEPQPPDRRNDRPG